MDDIDGKSHKTELKSSRNYSNKAKTIPLVIYGPGGVHTHIHSRNESDFKKPGVRWPQAGAHLV